MNLIRFFLPHNPICYTSYDRNSLNDEIIVPRIGELVWVDSECQEFVVKHIMHGYDNTGDMVDVFLDYPEEDYFDEKYWENPDTIEHDDYMDNLADDCNCPECNGKSACKDESNDEDFPVSEDADALLEKIKHLFNELGYDVDFEIHEFEV